MGASADEKAEASTAGSPGSGGSDAPNAASKLAALVEAVLEDHASLGKMVLRLRGLCMVLRDGAEPVDAEAERLMEEFERELVPHFAAEEAEEFFGSLVTEEPSLLQKVERLQAEHREMVEAADRLVEFASERPPSGALADRIGKFLDSFDAHEQAENALMREFVRLAEDVPG